MKSRLSDALCLAMKHHLAGGRPIVPEAGRDLWRIFVDLSAARTYHMAGPNPIAYAEIEAYARLVRWPLQPHHIDIIRAMDDAWLESTYARSSEGARKTAPRSSGQKMTADSLDMVLA